MGRPWRDDWVSVGYALLRDTQQIKAAWAVRDEAGQARLLAEMEELGKAAVTVLTNAHNEINQARSHLTGVLDQLAEQWKVAHDDRCGDWPHPEGYECAWPRPSTLDEEG